MKETKMSISTFYSLISKGLDKDIVDKMLHIKTQLHGKFNLLTKDETFYTVKPNPEATTEVERFNLYRNGSDYITEIAQEQGILLQPTLPELIVGFVSRYETPKIETKIPWITLSKFRTPENEPIWYSSAWFKCEPSNKNPKYPWDCEQSYEDMLGILQFLDEQGLLHSLKSEAFECLNYQVPKQFQNWDKLAKYI